MGRFQAADNPDDPQGERLAGGEGRRRPAGLERAANLWITETALSTALNVSYMAEQLALFGIVVGVASS